MASTTSQTVAARISDLMASSGVSAKALAESTGIPRTTLARRLTGNSPWTLSEVDLVAEHFGISPFELVDAA